MTREDVATVLGVFAAAWPWATVGPETARVWFEALRDESASMAREAALELARTEERPPAMARFREVRRALAVTVPDLPAIAEWSTSPEPDTSALLEHLADNRAVLAGAVDRVARRLPDDLLAAAKFDVEAKRRADRGPLTPCACFYGQPCGGVVPWGDE